MYSFSLERKRGQDKTMYSFSLGRKIETRYNHVQFLSRKGKGKKIEPYNFSLPVSIPREKNKE
jgi:hypothetical protein